MTLKVYGFTKVQVVDRIANLYLKQLYQICFAKDFIYLCVHLKTIILDDSSTSQLLVSNKKSCDFRVLVL